MKPNRMLAIVIGLAALSYSVNGYAQDVGEAGRETTVSFNYSKSFTDTKTRALESQSGESRVLDEVRRAFQKAADTHLPPEFRLDVIVDDIDLAGDRSALTSTYGEYRVVTDIYPPRIAFRYTVYGPGEQEVASGEARVSDHAFQYNAAPGRFRTDEVAPYVTQLISDWAGRELRKAGKTN